MKTLFFTLIILLNLSTCLRAYAHDPRPIVIEMKQQDRLVEIKIKAPASMTLEGFPFVSLEADCRDIQRGELQRTPGEYQTTQMQRCEQSIAGAYLHLTFPSANPSLSTMIKVQLNNGQQHHQLLAPNQSFWRIPEHEQTASIAINYIQMGAWHILKGWDHLLFVLCLMIFAGSAKRILITVTGFTLGHSITLTASTLQWIKVPVALAEALIALSIVFLAVEIAKQHKWSWTYQRPALVASVFGLLHGLGFASVLQGVGLPQQNLIWALLSFNIGIELGQVAFIAIVLACVRLLTAALPHKRLLAKHFNIFVYSVGTLSAFVFWQRSYQLFI